MPKFLTQLMRDAVAGGFHFHRGVNFDHRHVDLEARTVPAVLTTSARVEEFPGLYVTLSHADGAVDLSRAKDGLPLNFNHDFDNWQGEVTGVEILGQSHSVGLMRFADHQAANKTFRGIVEGFLRHVSAYGPIHEVAPDEANGEDSFIATRWGLHEASVVTVPKDAGARIGRAEHLAAVLEGLAPPALAAAAGELAIPVDTLAAITRGQVPKVSQETIETLSQALNGNADQLLEAAHRDGRLLHVRGDIMSEPRNDSPPAGGNPSTPPADPGPGVVSITAARSAGVAEGERQGREAERNRQVQIRAEFARFQGPGVEALRDDCILQGYSVARSRELLLEHLGGGTEPVGQPGGGHQVQRHQVQAGEDSLEKFRRGAEVSILERSKFLPREERTEAEGNEFRGHTLLELARAYLVNIGVSTRGMGRMQLVGQAFIRVAPGQGASDFSNLLADVANKMAGRGYDDAPESWRGYCRIGSLSDFKVGNRPVLSLFDSLDQIPESGEYKYGNFADKNETIQLATYGKLWGVTRKTIINDDLEQLTRVPMKLGAAAARVPGDLVVTNILLGNPTMAEDSTALFHADHSNLVAGGSGAAPSVSTVQAAETAMATQTSPATKTESGKTIGIPLRHLIVPVALKATANVLRLAQYDPAGTAGTLTPNPYMEGFEVHADHRIDADDAAKWFAAADPNQFDTLEVAFLDGVDAPFMEEDSPITVDGMVMKVRLDVGATALDYRGLYHNDGN